jgi:hypothetical protein
LLGVPASAQTLDEGPDPESARVRFGPLWINPSIALPNLGIDTNVFNEPSSASPKTDFTMTVTPKADLWLRMGRTWLSGASNQRLRYQQRVGDGRPEPDRLRSYGAEVGVRLSGGDLRLGFNIDRERRTSVLPE